MLAVFDGTSFVLFDPTRTTCSLFDAADYLSSTVPFVTCPIRPNVIVEVRHGVKWLAGIVKTVDRARGNFTVRLFKSGECICSTTAHTWRRVSEDSSDLDKHVVQGIKRSRE